MHICYISNKLKSLKVAKLKADGRVGDGSLDGAGVMNACVFDVVYDGVSDVVCNVVDDSVSGDEGCGKVKDCSISGFEDSNRSEVDIVSLIYISETNSSR